MSAITKIEVETWTRNETGSATDDQIDCVITFIDNSFFQQQLDNSGFNDFQQGHRNRFLLNLNTTSAAEAISGKQHTDIKSITIKKVNGSNTWKCAAVGIRVNDVVLLSRYVSKDLTSSGSSFSVLLRKNGVLDGLEVQISTGSWGGITYPGTDDSVLMGLKFLNGLNEIVDLQLTSTINDFEPESTYSYLIPLPSDPFTQTPSSIDELKIRKTGSDGWLLGGVQLFANGNSVPVLGNSSINQFLDSSNEVLSIRDWSSKRVAGPVLGCMSDTSAFVQFRVERTGFYRLQVYNHDSTSLIQTLDLELNPVGTFMVFGLSPNTHYDIKLFLLLNNVLIHVPNTDTSFRTFPVEGTGVKFSFGIGSCLRNRDNPIQAVWQQVKNISLDPAIDIVNDSPLNDLRFFIHTGDTHYFFDDVAKSELLSLVFWQNAAAAGHLSSRLNGNFLDMAKRVPVCAVWDDHDYRYNNLASDGLPDFIKGMIRDSFLSYWPNPRPFYINPVVIPFTSYGLTSRLSYGNVDIYLMDGRSNRIKSEGKFFGVPQIDFILQDIQSRGSGKLRIFVSGSLWNHTENDDDEKYGHSSYTSEREYFYNALNNLITQGNTKGILFISGDVHQNEIFEISLAQSGLINKAPEFVCSPLGNNGALKTADSIGGERKWRSKSELPNDNWGFASISIDTESLNWSIKIDFRKHSSGEIIFHKSYNLSNNQFIW